MATKSPSRQDKNFQTAGFQLDHRVRSNVSFDILSTVICPFKNSLSAALGAKQFVVDAEKLPLLPPASPFASPFAGRSKSKFEIKQRNVRSLFRVLDIVRDNQSLPDSIVKTENGLSPPFPFRATRFIGECNFRWPRNPRNRTGIAHRCAIYPIKLIRVSRRSFLSRFLEHVSPLLVSSRSNKSYSTIPNTELLLSCSQQSFAEAKFFLSFSLIVVRTP